VAESDEQIIHDSYLESFDADKGIHDLDVEVLSDASCLNTSHPRLRVLTNRDDYADYASPLLWLSALCVAVGISLLVLFSITQFSGRWTLAPNFALSGSVGQHFQWAQTLPLKKVFSGIRSFGRKRVVSTP